MTLQAKVVNIHMSLSGHTNERWPDEAGVLP